MPAEHNLPGRLATIKELEEKPLFVRQVVKKTPASPQQNEGERGLAFVFKQLKQQHFKLLQQPEVHMWKENLITWTASHLSLCEPQPWVPDICSSRSSHLQREQLSVYDKLLPVSPGRPPARDWSAGPPCHKPSKWAALQVDRTHEGFSYSWLSERSHHMLVY